MSRKKYKGKRYNLKQSRKRYIKNYNNWIDRAEAELTKAINLQNQLAKSGILVEGIDYKVTKERLTHYRDYVTNKNFTYKSAKKYLERIKDIATRHLLENTIQVKVTHSKPSGKGFSKPVDEVVTLRKINEIRKQHAKNPASIGTKNYNRMTQIMGALNPVSNAYAQAPDIKSMWQNRMRRTLDLSVGGHSTLINDLAYSMNAYGGTGRNFIDEVMSIMSGDEVLAREVEGLYRSSAAGREIKRYLDAATGAAWLDNFKNAIPGIMGLIRLVQNGIEKDNLASLDNLLEQAEMIGAESYEEYITGS